MNFYVKASVGVGLLIALALGALFLYSGQGEEAAIESLLRRAAEAVARGDAEAVVAIVSRDYRAGGKDYDAVARRIRQEVGLGRYTEIVLKGLAVEVREERAAEARVRLRVGPYGRGDLWLRLRFRKEPEVWKVVWAEEAY